jgi:hypothetical protein
MFALTPGDLLGKILDCAAGPSSFNAELIAEGHEVTSCDPIYSLSAEEIHARILATRDRMVANVRAAREEFVWQEFITPQHPGEVRMAAMQRFLTDFPEGLIQTNLQVGEGVDKRLDDALYPLGSSCSPGKSGSWRGNRKRRAPLRPRACACRRSPRRSGGEGLRSLPTYSSPPLEAHRRGVDPFLRSA